MCFLRLGAKKKTLMVHSKTSYEIAVIKCCLQEEFSEAKQLLLACYHENILAARAWYLHEENFYVVQEVMDVSLQNIIGLPMKLEEIHIRAVCWKVCFPLSSKMTSTKFYILGFQGD